MNTISNEDRENFEKLARELHKQIHRLKLITVKEAADIRGCSRSAIMQLISRKRLPVVRILGKPFVYKADVMGFEKKKSGPKPDTIFIRKQSASSD